MAQRRQRRRLLLQKADRYLGKYYTPLKKIFRATRGRPTMTEAPIKLLALVSWLPCFGVQLNLTKDTK